MSTDPRSRPNVAQIVQLHEEERHLMDYVRMVYKRRWIALPVFLVVVIVGAINSFRTTPIYEARTQLLIEKDLPKVGTLSTMFQEQDTWYNDDFYQTQYRILQSRTLARRAVELMNLPAHPSIIRGLPAETTPLSVMAVLSGAYDWIRQGGSKTPVAAAPAPEPEDRLAPYVNLMLGSLTVAPVRNSRLVELRFTSTDPQLATDMANGLAKAYIQQSMEFRFSASKDATDWLNAQLTEQRKKVEQSEAALQQYKEQHDAVAVEDRQNIVVQRLADLNAAVTRAKTDRITKEALYNQLKSVEGTPGIDSLPGGAVERLHPEGEDRARGPAAAAGAALREATASATRRW